MVHYQNTLGHSGCVYRCTRLLGLFTHCARIKKSRITKPYTHCKNHRNIFLFTVERSFLLLLLFIKYVRIYKGQ